MVAIETKSDHPDERSVQGVLGELLAEYDTSRWAFTDRVVIEEGAIPHSHPVLTIGTRFIVRSRLGLLTTYLHEQLHWYLVGREADGFAAIEDLRRLYPEVPDAAGGGADDEESTYLHLVVNWLELESLKIVAGTDEAEATLRQASDGPVYGWVYRQVFDNHDRIGDVIRRHGLDAILAGA